MRRLLLLLLLPGIAVPAFGQATDGRYAWGLRLVQDGTWLPEAGETWARNGMVVSRRTGRISVNAEAFRLRRGTREDMGLAADLYRPLWKGAYANVRVQHGNLQTALPRWDALLELYQSRGPWEASIGARRMRFASEDVDFWLGSLVRYRGLWYYRMRITALRHSRGPEGSLTVAARRYRESGGGDAAAFRQIQLGYGRDAQFLVPGTPVQVDHALSAGLLVQAYPFDPVGFTAGASATFAARPHYGLHVGLAMRFRN